MRSIALFTGLSSLLLLLLLLLLTTSPSEAAWNGRPFSAEVVSSGAWIS